MKGERHPSLPFHTASADIADLPERCGPLGFLDCVRNQFATQLPRRPFRLPAQLISDFRLIAREGFHPRGPEGGRVYPIDDPARTDTGFQLASDFCCGGDFIQTGLAEFQRYAELRGGPFDELSSGLKSEIQHVAQTVSVRVTKQI